MDLVQDRLFALARNSIYARNGAYRRDAHDAEGFSFELARGSRMESRDGSGLDAHWEKRNRTAWYPRPVPLARLCLTHSHKGIKGKHHPLLVALGLMLGSILGQTLFL